MEILRLLAKGAESEVYEGYFLGIHSVFKIRKVKKYRDPSLDKIINGERTLMEARLMYSALRNGINVPAIIYVDKEKFMIVMEFIKGKLLREILNNLSNLSNVAEVIGGMIGRLHSLGITHGDFTTSNLIVSTKNEIFLIDFGLAKRSDKIEDMAVDIHVFLRSLESVHYEVKDLVFKSLIKGYKNVNDKIDQILDKVREIRMRGRYVKERKKSLLYD
jgi:TP53 regulating kinase-like protein